LFLRAARLQQLAAVEVPEVQPEVVPLLQPVLVPEVEHLQVVVEVPLRRLAHFRRSLRCSNGLLRNPRR